MKKINISILFLSFLVIHSAVVKAQKKAAGVYPFTYLNGQVTETQTNVVYGEIASIIEKSGRFIAVNRSGFKQVFHEREINKGESFIDGKTIGEARDIGAQIVFVGNVLCINQDGDPVVHLSAVDAVTNQIMASEVISRTERRKVDISGSINDINNNLWSISGDGNTWRKLQTASSIFAIWNTFDKMTKKLDKQVESFLDEHFQLRVPIARYEDDGKEKMKKAFIKKEEAAGLHKNDSVEFVEEKTETNRDGSQGTSQKSIAKGKVDGVNGDYMVIRVTDDEKSLYTQKDNLKIFIIKK